MCLVSTSKLAQWDRQSAGPVYCDIKVLQIYWFQCINQSTRNCSTKTEQVWGVLEKAKSTDWSTLITFRDSHHLFIYFWVFLKETMIWCSMTTNPGDSQTMILNIHVAVLHLVQCVNMSDTPILPNAAIQSQHYVKHREEIWLNSLF